jgi:predicted MPP superfamily phosphohydrolase
LIVAVLFVIGYRNARADPVLRRVAIALPDWPEGAPPVTVALASDIHLGGSAMDDERLARLLDRIAAAGPDLALFAGDFISGHDPQTAIHVAPGLTIAFRRLRPRLGTIAVLGNHDHWTDPRRVSAALAAAGVTLLENRAVVRGPLAIGGVGDEYTHHDRVAATATQMRRLPGARLMLTHSPDIAPTLPAEIPLLLAGHTHCGQIMLPIRGAIAIPSRYGTRYRCGVIREGARTVIVTAGLGTSVVPLRFGAPPDVWLITLHGGR